MARTDQILADLATAQTNLTEVQGDLAEVLALNQQQMANIANLDAAIVQLQSQVGEVAALDQVVAAAAAIKDVTRQVADVVPEPAPTPQP